LQANKTIKISEMFWTKRCENWKFGKKNVIETALFWRNKWLPSVALKKFNYPYYFNVWKVLGWIRSFIWWVLCYFNNWGGRSLRYSPFWLVISSLVENRLVISSLVENRLVISSLVENRLVISSLVENRLVISSLVENRLVTSSLV